MSMHSPNGLPRTALALLVAGGLGVSSAAFAQNAPPPQEPPPAYNQPPPGYQQQPPPGYQQQPPPGYQQQPPPGYQPPPAAYAPPPGYAPPQPPPQNLHDGFYLRLHIGAGYGHMSANDSYGTAFMGGGASFGVAIGGTVAPNLVIFGNLFGIALADPDVELMGAPAGTATNTTTTISGIGPGLAYYFDPYNVYISGTIAATVFQASDSSNSSNHYDSDVGFGFQGMVGKEWWVSQDWGIGIAAEVLAATGMKDKVDPSVKWGGTSFALVFSATYN
jgi:hypothetical protein